MCKLRLSSPCLPLETGRYNNIPLESPLCTSDIENEYHFISKCPLSFYLRKKLLLYMYQTFCL